MRQNRTNTGRFKNSLKKVKSASPGTNSQNRRRGVFGSLANYGMGAFLLTTFSGCFFIPTWRIPNYEPCQSVENAWGDVVDTVGHQSPVDQPWHDPCYCPQGVYRVAIPGQWHPGPEIYPG
ncbi:MAG: hypothetical protein KDA84_27870, partial [Planctomycetaceae bacterium]|nr:hypothetical protein [Planctomycetaceae bacterium]